jgi:hypothetical protein
MIVIDLYGCMEAARAGKRTYLAIDWSRDRRPDDVEDYGYESGYPCKGVHLTKTKSQSGRLSETVTDPNWPTPVAAMPSDNTPLKVQSGEEFPPEMWNVGRVRVCIVVVKGRQHTRRRHKKHARALLPSLFKDEFTQAWAF